MPTVGGVALRVIGVVGVLALAAACSSGEGAGDEAEPEGETDRPSLAFVEVLRQDEVREVPPADIYLVELGEPLGDGWLVDEDSGLATFEIADINQHPYDYGDGDSDSAYVTLPDGRLLVAVERPDADEEYLSRLGAVVVDPETGEVHDVTRSGDGHRGNVVSRWDPDRRMLRTGLDPDAIRCFAWDEETAGSGFTDIECPPVDSPEDAGTRLAHWDFDCCDPFQLTDRETGEVVFEQDGLPHPPQRSTGAAPMVLEQRGETLVFTSPPAPGVVDGAGPFDLLVLRADGEVVEVEPRRARYGLDRGYDTVRLVGDVVLYTDVEAGALESSDRLVRFDVESREAEVLLGGARIAWGVVPAEEPWLVASHARGDPEGHLGEPEPLVTTLWVGEPESGALEQVAEWPDQDVDLSWAEFDQETGALYVRTEATGAGDFDPASITLWRVEPGAPPAEVASGPDLDLVDVAPDGESIFVRVDVDGQWVLRLIVDGEPYDLGDTSHVQFLDDETFLYWVHTSRGAAYTSSVVSRSLADPGTVEVVYDDRTAEGEPRAVRLGPVLGARPSPMDSRLFCVASCTLDLPQPWDLGWCAEDPTYPGC